ncbi:MAG: hypothetical protein LC778_14560 [Acidobacteria bacterium]|nr:hypothetical protein [Acidobacteriota bacterium]
MKNKTEKALPKMMSGSVHKQFVRCGKTTCRCARGELHGAYYYYFKRVNGKLSKRYLKPHEVKQMQAACLAWREEKRAGRAHSRETWRLIRKMSARLRDVLKQVSFTGD